MELKTKLKHYLLFGAVLVISVSLLLARIHSISCVHGMPRSRSKCNLSGMVVWRFDDCGQVAKSWTSRDPLRMTKMIHFCVVG